MGNVTGHHRKADLLIADIGSRGITRSRLANRDYATRPRVLTTGAFQAGCLRQFSSDDDLPVTSRLGSRCIGRPAASVSAGSTCLRQRLVTWIDSYQLRLHPSAVQTQTGIQPRRVSSPAQVAAIRNPVVNHEARINRKLMNAAGSAAAVKPARGGATRP